MPHLRQVARWVLAAAAVTVMAVLLFMAGRGSRLPSISEEQLRTAITTSIQREARQSFLVTGRIDVSASTQIENNRIFHLGCCAGA